MNPNPPGSAHRDTGTAGAVRPAQRPAGMTLAQRVPRDGWTLLLMALVIVSGMAWWIWRDWQNALHEAGAEFEHVARANTLALSLAARDAQRLQESMDARLNAGRPLTVALLLEERGERFQGGEVVDYLPGDGRTRPLSTAPSPLDPSVWRAQLQRVPGTAQPTFGWAYPSGARWMLPVIYRRADGSHIIVSLPVEELTAQWIAPNLQGETPLGLRGPDDQILLRQPFTTQRLGADASASASAQAIHETLRRGQTSGHVITQANETDHVHRLIAWAQVPGTGVNVLVAAARDDLTRRWLDQRAGSHALVLLLLVSGFAVAGRSRARLQAAARSESRARQEAERGNELLRHALDTSRDSIWQFDPASGELRFDSDLGLLLGLAPGTDEADPDLRRSFPWLQQQVHEADRDRLGDAVRRMVAERLPLYEQFSATALDGSGVRHFILKGGFASDTQPALALGTLRDVTRLVESQAVAARSLQTLERMCRLARIEPWTAAPRTGLFEMSPGARAIYGMAPDAPAGPWLTFPGVDPAAMDVLMAARHRLLRYGTGYDLILPTKPRDGAQRWIRSTAAAVRGENGEIERIDGAVQDVTETVLAQRQLEASDRRLRELALVVSNSSQLLLITDAQEGITWCNAAFERVSGYALAEIRGLKPGPLLQHGLTPTPVRERMRRGIEAREPVRGLRLKNFSKAGRAYWVDVELTPVLSEDGTLQSYIGLQTDVTEDIEREQRLADTQARYELATRNASIGIWEREFATRSTRWNEVMFQLTGLRRGDGVPRGEALHQRVHEDDRSPTLKAFRSAARDPATARFESDFRLERSPGEFRWMRNQCVFERDARGRPTRVVGTLLDITVERELSQERQARAEADARSAAKTAFLSSMSHELRTPLNAVIGYAQIVNSSEQNDAAAMRRRVQIIETAGWHLLALIDDILDLARIESGAVSIEHQPVPLAEVVADAVNLITEHAGRRQIRVESSQSEAWVMGDPRRLRQVMTNLLSNAVKYNIEGGSVQVRLDRDEQHARIEVRDTGLGMTREQLAQLYQPFNRLGRENTEVQGTGIGLTITRTLVQQMGGTMDVVSRLGEGTSFRLMLPLTAPLEGRESAAPGPASTRVAQPRSLEVLCVEDNEVNALVLEESVRLLQPLARVRHARSLEAASRALAEGLPDVIFLDQNLPDGQGLAWLAQGPSRGLVERSRVVMLTADAMPEMRQRALAQGVTLFMHKPFGLDELRALLELAAGEVALDPVLD